ncbi:MAG: siroheme synthase CysG [Ferrovibrio sp.]|uniref:siroheme synthase CysG n=1 Tax=Ferrovibrio sp. TaxID=1917215 RepID=UPI00261C4F0E|nr:siroheme synthase CysG [Ferrovibrio sp.]MCW0233761.1 siroheme synthase CysG [Ferrovibrio sp.]
MSRKPAEAQRHQRIGALAKLPVFLDLQGRRAVIAGGTAAAAWKAELLAAAGAAVTVYAEDSSAEMQALDMKIITRRWQPADLKDATLAIIDAEDADAAAAFHVAAKAAGAICSAIDKPDHCDVQFGAIVNRSPVVIGISTDGAAPILAQAIRRRIETLLPATLGAWAAAAKRIRKTVAERLPVGGLRRAFWERFAERAFLEAQVPADIEIQPAKAAANRIGGHVTLVGAGPGDAELLTLKAMRALQAADVILFDDLVSDEVLELARREAKRMMVGKRGGRASCRQEDINALMIKLARQGKRVVRLKAGDPMVFGRAGEEIAALDAAGIPVAVIPGITAALAAASSLGVSLTHRDAAHSVRFVTGHSRQGHLPDDLDWRGLADPETSLMVYMGGRTGGAFAAKLIAEGLAPATPVAVVSAVSRADETRWCGRLSDLGAALLEIGVEQPVLVGIGQVFAAARVQAAGGAIERVA